MSNTDRLFSNRIISLMLNFQKENSIKNCCLQNCQYLYDVLKKHTSLDYKPKIVIVYYCEDVGDTRKHYFHIHSVLTCVINGVEKMCDPSFEIFSIEKKEYFKTIKEFSDFIKNHSQNHTLSENQKEEIKLTTKRFLEFIPNEKIIMNSKEPLITNPSIYNSQADYIQANF